MPENPYQPPKELGTPADPVDWPKVFRVVAVILCVAMLIGGIAFMVAIGSWELDAE
jgi:hypothetical protein